MITAHVIYTGELRSKDAPVDNHGKGERFSPTDLVATALATCIVTTLGIAAPTHDLHIDGAECEVTKIMVSDPRRIGEIIVKMTFPRSAPFTDKQKQVIERIARTCPVFESLHPDLKKTMSFEWPE